jgi:hypothetical protein
MAEEKKPKIDLKARLGKTGLNPAAQVPPPAAGIPVPAPAPGGPPPSRPPPQPPAGGLPVPPGVPIGPPPGFGKGPGAGLDPSNPLAAAVAPPYRAPAPAAPAQPQRIEVDELSLQEARKGARKQGLVAGLVAAAVFGIIGFFAGGAQETKKGREKAVGDAKSLATDVNVARDQLKSLGDKLEGGREALRQRKFPDDLARDLGGINVDFDGRKLAGVRFSGFPQETTSGLIEFITGVQEVNDRKSALSSILARLQKPLSEQFAAGGKTSIGYVALLGKRDPSGNHFALLAPLTAPIEVTNPAQISLPAELTASDPTGGGNVSAPPYKGGSVDKGAAVYVLPKSIEAACPSESAGQVPMLVGQLNRLITDIKGEEAAPGEEIIRDTKAGLLERADKLVTGLNKVQ